MSHKESFINDIKDGAIRGWESHKVLASVSIAQGILESNWGRSDLAKKANNIFGIKGSHKGQSYIVKTWEHVDGKDIMVDASFRKYQSWGDSLVDHAKFFSSTAWRANNYRHVIGEINYKRATSALSKAGYATDPNYSDKLNNIIETYNLTEYDKKGVKKMAKIYIDPGHGGTDPGASGGGLVEKQWVLEVSLELAKILRGLGHSVKLSRTNDTFISLSGRSADANRWGADIFVSIHFNAGGGFGWEDFIFNGRVSNNTKKLQNEIHEAIKPILSKHGMKNRGKKTANYSVLRQTSAPAVLVEGGFVDTTDNSIMKKSGYKKDVAVALANGIQKYFGLSAVSGSTSSTNTNSTGWIKNATGWWYKNSDGSYPKSKWQKIGSKWYLFDSRGYMLTGWQRVKNKWYYMTGSGAMQTGWNKVGNTWYYMNSSGAMQTSWLNLNNHWYYLNSSGAMQKWWFQTKKDGPWFYSNGSGQMQIGWLKDKNGKWFYLRGNGHMATGLLKIDGKHYYLQHNGELITDEVIELEANKSGHLK